MSIAYDHTFFPGHYYTDDQQVNIYTFSMLYQWIYHSYEALMNSDASSVDGDDEDICIDEELELYRAQAQPIAAGSKSSWLSRSMSLGFSSSPTSSQASVEVWTLIKTIGYNISILILHFKCKLPFSNVHLAK